MNLLPQAYGSRPRLACEIAVGGVVAGRSSEATSPLTAVARVELPAGTVTPSLRPGNLSDRVAVIAAVRRTLEQVGGRSHARNGDLTLILPDAAVRVLLLDFDVLPSKLSEALPIVRFRLRKAVPFDPDAAMVSFQVMSTSRSMVRVLAVAIPRDVLSEYESVVREAGFEPGAVLPSTLGALAALDEGEGAALVVNAHEQGVTTAIVRAGIVLLHRSVEMTNAVGPLPAGLAPALFDGVTAAPATLALIDREESQAEWAAQEPLPEFGRNPYADRIGAETVTQDQDGAGSGNGRVIDPTPYRMAPPTYAATIDMYGEGEATVEQSPYDSVLLQQDLQSRFDGTELPTFPPLSPLDNPAERSGEAAPPIHTLTPDLQAEELAQAVSVAMAYFEDSLGAVPTTLLSAGPLGAERLLRTLQEQGLDDGLSVRELIKPEDLAQTAVSSAVPRDWLAGIRGALRS